MRKAGIITALLCLAAAALFLLWPRAQQPPEPQELTVTDSTGRQVTLPTHPQRVVILNPSNLDLYVAAGGAENVVGKPTSQALSETVKEKTAAAEEVGIIHQPDIEKILALQPDLVIGTNVPFHTALDEALSNVGVPLYIQALDDVPSLFGALELYGRLTGHEDDAAAQIAAIRQKLDAVKKKPTAAHRRRISSSSAHRTVLTWARQSALRAVSSRCSAAAISQTGRMVTVPICRSPWSSSHARTPL